MFRIFSDDEIFYVVKITRRKGDKVTVRFFRISARTPKEACIRAVASRKEFETDCNERALHYLMGLPGMYVVSQGRREICLVTTDDEIYNKAMLIALAAKYVKPYDLIDYVELIRDLSFGDVMYWSTAFRRAIGYGDRHKVRRMFRLFREFLNLW